MVCSSARPLGAWPSPHTCGLSVDSFKAQQVPPFSFHLGTMEIRQGGWPPASEWDLSPPDPGPARKPCGTRGRTGGSLAAPLLEPAAQATGPDPRSPLVARQQAGGVRLLPDFFSFDAIPGTPSLTCLSPALTGRDWNNSSAHSLSGTALGARRQWPARPGSRICAAHLAGKRETKNKGTADTRIRGAGRTLEGVKAGEGLHRRTKGPGFGRGVPRGDGVTMERALWRAGREAAGSRSSQCKGPEVPWGGGQCVQVWGKYGAFPKHA